jgi:hypothetical protein
VGEASGAPGGVFDDGTREEDGPVTWETLVSSRETPAKRGAGDQPPHTARAGGRRPRRGRAEKQCGPAKNEPSASWQAEARGTGAEADGDEGVGGPNRSDEVG